MARFFTADLHLGHCNIARYEPERARGPVSVRSTLQPTTKRRRASIAS